MACCWLFHETGTTRVFRVGSCTTAKTGQQRLGRNEHHRLQSEEGTTIINKEKAAEVSAPMQKIAQLQYLHTYYYLLCTDMIYAEIDNDKAPGRISISACSNWWLS